MDPNCRPVWQRTYEKYCHFFEGSNELSGSDYDFFEEVMDNFRKYVNSMEPQEHLQTYNGNKFPCFANEQKIKIDLDHGYGRLIRAKQTIDFDEVVFRSAPFATAVETTEHKYCLTCNKIPTEMGTMSGHDAFIQCRQCQIVFFCSLQCKEANQSHKFECRTCFQFIDDADIKLCIQMVFEAMTLFGTAKQMQEYIEQIVNEGNFNQSVPTGSFDKQSRFDCIMRLHAFDVDDDQCRTARIAYNLIMEIPVIKMSFVKKSQTCFLKRLLLHFLGVIYANAFGPALVIPTHPDETELSRLMIFDVFSLFNHSCCPNVKYYFEDNCNTMIGRANHRINRNEQLFISYSFCYYRNKAVRRAEIQRNWKFRCHCNRCRNNITTEQLKKATHPKVLPNLRNIMGNIDTSNWNGQNCAYILSYMMNIEPKQLNS